MVWRKTPVFLQTSTYRNDGSTRLALISLDVLAAYFDTSDLTPPLGPGVDVEVGNVAGTALHCTLTYAEMQRVVEFQQRNAGTFNQNYTPLSYVNNLDNPGTLILENIAAIFNVAGAVPTYNVWTTAGTDAGGHGDLGEVAARMKVLGVGFTAPFGIVPSAGTGWLPEYLWRSP